MASISMRARAITSKVLPELGNGLYQMRLSSGRALHHQLERLFRFSDAAHAVMNSAGSEPDLGDFKAPALAQ